MKEQIVQEPLTGLLQLESNSSPRVEVQREDKDELTIAVSLGKRAAALEAIMAYYNQASRVHGIDRVVGSPQSDFSRRYKDREANVQQGATVRRDQLREGFQEGIAVLAAADALVASGQDESDVDVMYRTIQADLNRKFGIGSKAKSADRKKVVEAARRSLPKTDDVE